MIERLQRDTGAALVMVVMALALLTSLSAALLLSATSELLIAATFTSQRAALYAADAILERALIDAEAAPDWSTLISGTSLSSFEDGQAGGRRSLADGTIVDLDETLDMARCHKRSACTDAELTAVTPDRPWGARNPRWQLFAYGPLHDMLPGIPVESWYGVAMVAANPAGIDGAITIRAEAYGPRHAHAIVEAVVARDGGDSAYNDGTPRMISWREVR